MLARSQLYAGLWLLQQGEGLRGDPAVRHAVMTAVHTRSEKVHVRLKQDPAPWLAYEGRWGSTVEAPAMQEWFAKAENPVSRPWIAQVGTLRSAPTCLIPQPLVGEELCLA